MTVLLVDSARECGGAQRSLCELAVALQERGVTVHAAVPAGSLASALQGAGVSVRLLPAVRLHRGLRPPALLEIAHFIHALLVLARAIRAVRPDIIHANGLTPALLAVNVHQQRPVLWHVRDLAMPFSSVRYLSRRAACIVGISDPVAEYLSETVPSFHRRKVRLIRNGIDTGHFRPGDRAAARRAFQLPADAPLVGMISHLVPWKRHDFFLALAAAIRQTRRDVRFVIAGRDLFHDHPRLRARLDAQIAAAGLADAVRWLPDLDDIAPLLPALDALVHPAANEPFGRVLCEAMAAGIPVVAANRAGPLCIVPDNEAGYLVPPADAAAFARQTLRLLDNPENARRMGAAARQHVLDNFNIQRTAAEMHALYDKILGVLALDRQRQEDEKARRRHQDADDDE